MRLTEFKNVRVNTKFKHGGNFWFKKSTRTAKMVESPYRIFYFGMNEIVQLNGEHK